jgi:hypothetical protein
MMRNFNTVVLERLKFFHADFATEPYEAGWASEALFFIRVHSLEGSDPVLHSRVQISADGIEWIDEGTSFEPIDREGNYFIRVKHFGGWLRLASVLDGEQPEIKLTIQLALKE